MCCTSRAVSEALAASSLRRRAWRRSCPRARRSSAPAPNGTGSPGRACRPAPESVGARRPGDQASPRTRIETRSATDQPRQAAGHQRVGRLHRAGQRRARPEERVGFAAEFVTSRSADQRDAALAGQWHQRHGHRLVIGPTTKATGVEYAAGQALARQLGILLVVADQQLTRRPSRPPAAFRSSTASRAPLRPPMPRSYTRP